jgi:hypothetical protein
MTLVGIATARISLLRLSTPTCAFCRNTTDCPSSSNASRRHAPCRHASATKAIMIPRSTIVPAAMFSPSAARWRCASLQLWERCAILGSVMRSSARALGSQGPGAGGGASGLYARLSSLACSAAAAA